MIFQDDFHIHASFYRNEASRNDGPLVIDQIRAAESAGGGRIGIVEHCNSSERHPFSSLLELKAEFESLPLDRKRFFRGVEADLLPGGLDSCGRSGRRILGLDYVIGSVHLSPAVIPRFASYLEEEFTRIMLCLKNNENVEVIGHPFISGERYQRAGVIEKWSFAKIPPQWLTEIIETAKLCGKALEVNYFDFSDPVYKKFLADMRDAGVLFAIGSDAHFTEGCVKAAEYAGILNDMGFDSANQWYPGKGE